MSALMTPPPTPLPDIVVEQPSAASLNSDLRRVPSDRAPWPHHAATRAQLPSHHVRAPPRCQGRPTRVPSPAFRPEPIAAPVLGRSASSSAALAADATPEVVEEGTKEVAEEITSVNPVSMRGSVTTTLVVAPPVRESDASPPNFKPTMPHPRPTRPTTSAATAAALGLPYILSTPVVQPRSPDQTAIHQAVWTSGNSTVPEIRSPRPRPRRRTESALFYLASQISPTHAETSPLELLVSRRPEPIPQSPTSDDSSELSCLRDELERAEQRHTTQASRVTKVLEALAAETVILDAETANLRRIREKLEKHTCADTVRRADECGRTSHC